MLHSGTQPFVGEAQEARHNNGCEGDYLNVSVSAKSNELLHGIYERLSANIKNSRTNLKFRICSYFVQRNSILTYYRKSHLKFPEIFIFREIRKNVNYHVEASETTEFSQNFAQTEIARKRTHVNQWI